MFDANGPRPGRGLLAGTVDDRRAGAGPRGGVRPGPCGPGQRRRAGAGPCAGAGGDRRLRRPVVAPSANRSGRPSPTTFADAVEETGTFAAAVLDGGPCEVGVESTVVSVLDGRVALLRPGSVTRSERSRPWSGAWPGAGRGIARRAG